MKTAIRLAWTNVQKGHPANETKLATTPMKRAVFMCKTGAVVSAEFLGSDAALNETFTVLHLPESMAFPHSVRVCNVCCNAGAVDAAITSYMPTPTTADDTGGAPTPAPDSDATESGMEKVNALLDRVAIYNSWDARIHLECGLHVDSVKARSVKDAAAATAAAVGVVSVPEEVQTAMMSHLLTYTNHAKHIGVLIQTLTEEVTKALGTISARLAAIEAVVKPPTK
jgi:hypothetical protein